MNSADELIFVVVGVIFTPLVLWILYRRAGRIVSLKVIMKYPNIRNGSETTAREYRERTDSSIFGHELAFVSIGIFLSLSRVIIQGIDIVLVLEEVTKVVLYTFTLLTLYLVYDLISSMLGNLDRCGEANDIALFPIGSKGWVRMPWNKAVSLVINVTGSVSLVAVAFLGVAFTLG